MQTKYKLFQAYSIWALLRHTTQFHSFQLSTIQTSITSLFFIQFWSGLQHILWFNEGLHFKFTVTTKDKTMTSHERDKQWHIQKCKKKQIISSSVNDCKPRPFLWLSAKSLLFGWNCLHQLWKKAHVRSCLLDLALLCQESKTTIISCFYKTN